MAMVTLVSPNWFLLHLLPLLLTGLLVVLLASVRSGKILEGKEEAGEHDSGDCRIGLEIGEGPLRLF